MGQETSESLRYPFQYARGATVYSNNGTRNGFNGYGKGSGWNPEWTRDRSRNLDRVSDLFSRSEPARISDMIDSLSENLSNGRCRLKTEAQAEDLSRHHARH